jgi:DNA repair exonuclease SbcCD ATPase subunit
MQKQYIAKTVELISEKGIKKYIIDKYIPILNQSLNQYLKKFNAPYSVMFNSEMEENIIARGYEDLSYNNLSSGEKQRLDSALLFSFLNLSKMKNSVNVNILFMDEVLDQSLDQQGIDGIMAIFNEMKKDGYSIFVVSHREGVQENFEIIIEVGKKKFSEVSYS